LFISYPAMIFTAIVWRPWCWRQHLLMLSMVCLCRVPPWKVSWPPQPEVCAALPYLTGTVGLHSQCSLSNFLRLFPVCRNLFMLYCILWLHLHVSECISHCWNVDRDSFFGRCS
jgi:hypothetical protein